MSDIQSFSPLWGIWEIGDLIGKGSYGSVYKVSRHEHGAEYVSAVKHLAIPLEPSFTQSLYSEGIISDENSEREYYNEILMTVLDEIRTNYRLRGNSNIVSYEDHIVVPRRNSIGYDIFIRMELLTTLSDYISTVKNNNFTEKDVIALGTDMASALEILEHENILHRDIKTSNIFVTSAGKYKLGDFGVSRSLESSMTHMSIKGTFDYMPPEIQYGNSVSHTADIYSLGLVLYRLCNGNRKPFLPPPPATITHEENNRANEKRLQGMPIPAPAMASPALSDVILRACAYESQNRFQTATELKQALTGALYAPVDEPYDEDKTIGVFDNPASYQGTSNTYGAYSAPPPPPPPPPRHNPEPAKQPDYSAYAAPAQSKKKNKILPIVIGLALVLVSVSATAMFMSHDDEDDKVEETVAPEETASAENSPIVVIPDVTVTASPEPATKTDIPEPTPTPKPEPTPTPEPATQSNISATNNYYILYNSDSAYLTSSDLDMLSWRDLCLARNEIYARHDYAFVLPDVYAYFIDQAWYTPIYSAGQFDFSSLNQYESYNISFISQYENQNYGGSYY